MNRVLLRKPEHRRRAETYLDSAEKLLDDREYIKLRGYNEINVLLRMADIHERLSK